jgi:putative transposase
VSAHRAVYPIAAMCRVLGVSSSGYYAWAKRARPARATSDAALIERIGAIHAASHRTYGSPRVHAELAESGLHISRKRVARLMKTAGLAGVSRRRFVTTTVRDGSRQAPDLVERAFKAEAPNVLWVADITYIPTWSGFLYLAVVLDVFSRRIVGWSMSLTLHTNVVLAALNMALAVRRPKNVIHHSDQGSQYTSIAFGKRCREAGVRPSMGSVGDAYDNAMAESFFATLECELLERRRFKTQAEARMAVFAFIEGFYNPRRRHSALGYLSPVTFERQHAPMAEKRSASSPGEPNHAAVLAPIKHKPSRARKLRVLDRDCARTPSLRMGRDEGTASAAAEQRNWIEKEDDTTPAAQLP